MRIILIRHGETYANTLFGTDEQILIGALDAPISQLNEVGKQQAIQAGDKIKHLIVDEIYSSDLGRTIETTSLVFPNRTFETTHLLRERSLGSDEGLKASEVFAREDAMKHYVDSDNDSVEDCMNKRVDDGESYQMVCDRLREFLSQFDYTEDKTVACIAHFHTIRCMTYVLLDKEPDTDIAKLMIPNATPIFFEYKDGKFNQVESFE